MSTGRSRAAASAVASAPSISVTNCLRATLCGLRTLRARSRARRTVSRGTVIRTPSTVTSRSPRGTRWRSRTARRSTLTIFRSPLISAAAGSSSGAAETPGNSSAIEVSTTSVSPSDGRTWLM